ncbi:M23 family metallopeptidase [Gelria sp. Kuro-4]|uniref:M23 family metallopeptidase n=1 Tax=Gelria sp. Kuro-4 TaxID=2796927 RepID=UPI001BEE9EA7|nr:M23 family metallopeptidase [Gelria sp. Kuro-4]BCV23935.1 peptidase M23 [Gelria sp. Kuro-4]
MPWRRKAQTVLGRLKQQVKLPAAVPGVRLRGRRRLAAGAALVLLLAAFATALPLTQKAWAVSVDGQVIGWTGDREATAAAVNEILARDGAGPGAAARVSYSPVPRYKVKLTPTEDMKEKLACSLLKLREAWQISVAGRPVVAVGSEEEARAVVTRVKAAFPPAPGAVLKKVALKEDVTFTPQLIKADQVRSVEEAAAYLLRGTDETRVYEVKAGDSLWSIARAHDLHVADLQQANPGVTERLQLGQKLNLVVPRPYVTVVTQEEKTVSEAIPFAVETVKDSSLYTYEKKVKTPGEAGSKKVTYALVRENGQVRQEQVVTAVVEKEPVTQVVAVGTREPAVVGTGRYIWPLSRGGGVVTSRFGQRGGEFHQGVDIAAPTGTPVLAADSGVVSLAGWNGGYGKCIIITHGNGSATLYGHLSQIFVREGQKVTKGKTIGLVGSTGRSTGSHLHFETMQGGAKKNPLAYFKHQ